LYGGKTVAMIGGGDSSVKGVNFLGEYAKKIYLIVRGSEVRAEPVNAERMKKLGDKVEVLLEHEVKEIVGEKMLEKLVLSGEKDLVVDGMFIEIGFDPDKTFAEQLGLELDEKGYMKVDNMMRTKVPGIFAAGDATTHFGSFKQDITAAAMGAVAATAAYEYLAQK
jgi:thioredoxin reductase (NADPH)